MKGPRGIRQWILSLWHTSFMGYIAIAIGIFLGFIGIAFAIFVALRALRTDIKGGLSTIKEKIIPIQETVGSVWDVVKRSPILGETGTVERNLTNLGNLKITAEPHLAHH